VHRSHGIPHAYDADAAAVRAAVRFLCRASRPMWRMRINDPIRDCFDNEASSYNGILFNIRERKTLTLMRQRWRRVATVALKVLSRVCAGVLCPLKKASSLHSAWLQKWMLDWDTTRINVRLLALASRAASRDVVWRTGRMQPTALTCEPALRRLGGGLVRAPTYVSILPKSCSSLPPARSSF
jgi:hypothetical protein